MDLTTLPTKHHANAVIFAGLAARDMKTATLPLLLNRIGLVVLIDSDLV